MLEDVHSLLSFLGHEHSFRPGEILTDVDLQEFCTIYTGATLMCMEGRGGISSLVQLVLNDRLSTDQLTRLCAHKNRFHLFFYISVCHFKSP